MIKNELTVIPNGGLGNRMRVMQSAISLAKKHDLKLTVIWEKDWGLNVAFDQLFEPIPEIKMVISKRSFWKKLETRLDSKFDYFKWKDYILFNKNRIREKSLYTKLNSGWKLTDFESYFDKLVVKKSLFIDCCWQFYPVNVSLSSIFKPNNDINTRVNKFIQTMKTNLFLGIHIRRTDNKMAIEKSPINLFFENASYYLNENSNSVLFLSTDSLDVENEMKEKYKKQVFIQSTDKSRGSIEGIKQALVDMLILSKSNKIIGSYWSTFSIVSSEIGNIELEILQNEENLKKMY